MSFQGALVLEKTAQVARHIRCIVLRRITEVAGYRRSNAGHGSCDMGAVCARSSTHLCDTSLDMGGKCPASHLLSNAGPQSIPSGMTSSVSQSWHAATEYNLDNPGTLRDRML